MWDSALIISQAESPKGKTCLCGGATKLSAPPYEVRFSHKIKIQPNDDSDSDLVSGGYFSTSNTGNHAFGDHPTGQEFSHSC
jgi:hypothetical protein